MFWEWIATNFEANDTRLSLKQIIPHISIWFPDICWISGGHLRIDKKLSCKRYSRIDLSPCSIKAKILLLFNQNPRDSRWNGNFLVFHHQFRFRIAMRVSVSFTVDLEHAMASMSMNILAGALYVHSSGIYRWFTKPDVRVCRCSYSSRCRSRYLPFIAYDLSSRCCADYVQINFLLHFINSFLQVRERSQSIKWSPSSSTTLSDDLSRSWNGQMLESIRSRSRKQEINLYAEMEQNFSVLGDVFGKFRCLFANFLRHIASDYGTLTIIATLKRSISSGTEYSIAQIQLISRWREQITDEMGSIARNPGGRSNWTKRSLCFALALLKRAAKIKQETWQKKWNRFASLNSRVNDLQL